MARFEPAMIDNAGATWTSMDTYRLVPSAKRYEFYERSVAAVVCLCHLPPPPTFLVWDHYKKTVQVSYGSSLSFGNSLSFPSSGFRKRAPDYPKGSPSSSILQFSKPSKATCSLLCPYFPHQNGRAVLCTCSQWPLLVGGIELISAGQPYFEGNPVP